MIHYGYPDDNELDYIEKHQPQSWSELTELLDYIRQRWAYSNWGWH